MLVNASAWLGRPETKDAVAALPAVEEAHIVAGAASMLLKIRTSSPEELQDVLRRIHEIEGVVAGTETIVVLEQLFERTVNPAADPLLDVRRRADRSRGGSHQRGPSSR